MRVLRLDRYLLRVDERLIIWCRFGLARHIRLRSRCSRLSLCIYKNSPRLRDFGPVLVVKAMLTYFLDVLLYNLPLRTRPSLCGWLFSRSERWSFERLNIVKGGCTFNWSTIGRVGVFSGPAGNGPFMSFIITRDCKTVSLSTMKSYQLGLGDSNGGLLNEDAFGAGNKLEPSWLPWSVNLKSKTP